MSSCSFCRFSGHNIRQCVSPRSFELQYELQGWMNINCFYSSTRLHQLLSNYSYRDIRMMIVIITDAFHLNQTKEILITELIRCILLERETRRLRRMQFMYHSHSHSRTVKFIPRKEKENELPIVYEECPICYESIPPSNLCLTNCNHSFCTQCIMKSLKTKSSCPCCRETVVTLEREPKVPL